MAKQKYTLHMHTVRFDGQNTIAEMVSQARNLGFNTVGISDHFIVHPAIKKAKFYYYSEIGRYCNIYSASFKEANSKFKTHYAEIEKIRKLYPEMNILRGMEVDFFDNDEWKQGFQESIELLKPDYVIGSAHFVEKDGLLLNTHDWKNTEKESEQKLLLEMYWTNVAKAAESGLFTWMAHLDLPKKAGLGFGDEWMRFENRAVKAAAKSNTAIEINTSFYRDYCYEPYPSNRVLKMIKKNKVSVLLSDDAHSMQAIGRHFDEAQELIKMFKLKTFDVNNIIK